MVLGTETFNEPVKAAVAEAYFFLADIFKSTESSLKKAREEAEGGWIGWRAFKLMDKIVESDKHVSFIFTSADGQPIYKYLPGQYVSIKIDGIPGESFITILKLKTRFITIKLFVFLSKSIRQ